MGVLLVHGGWAAGLPRIRLGTAMDACDGYAMGLPWVRHVSAMGPAWVGRGSAMVPLRVCRESAMGRAGSATGMLRICYGYATGML